MSDALRPAVRPADERLREQGLQVVIRFLALLRTARSYQVENQVFRQQAGHFVETLRPVFADVPEAVIVALDNDLYLNGVRLPIKVTNLRFHRALMEEFARRQIAGVRVFDGVDEQELERFFLIFLRSDLYCGPALLEACLEQRTGRILPVVHASTEEGDPNADPFDPLSYQDWTPAEQAGGFGSPEDGGDGHGSGFAGVPSVKPAAKKSYSLAMVGARSLLSTTALQEGMETRHAKRVVQPLIDGAFAGEPVVVGLSSLSHHDEYTYAHSVNVCMVAVTMGHMLGLDRRALADLGVAALLHDVGKAAVYDRIEHALEDMTPEERALAERHAIEGAKLIARSTALNGTTLRCIRTALEHHARRAPGCAGYPAGPEGWRASRFAQIVSCADCYVNLQMHRSERGRDVTPYQALGMVLGHYAERFDPAVLHALIRTLGFYPPGQLVELSDGRTAIVLAPNKDDLGRPHVRVIVDECGVPFSPVEAKELKPIPPTLAVARALASHEYPEIPLEG